MVVVRPARGDAWRRGAAIVLSVGVAPGRLGGRRMLVVVVVVVVLVRHRELGAGPGNRRWDSSLMPGSRPGTNLKKP